MSEPEHISPEAFDRLFPDASRSTREANLAAWLRSGKGISFIVPKPCLQPVNKPARKRIRQDSKPLLNQLEERFSQVLKSKGISFRPQAKRYRLANGTWYKPDFTAIVDGKEHAWECKGPHAFRGGFENLKIAASTFPEITWHLVWEEPWEEDKTRKQWKEQIVLP